MRLWVEIEVISSKSTRFDVSLLVRLWVEMNCSGSGAYLDSSASLWGCELKYPDLSFMKNRIASASLWGCELKSYHFSQHTTDRPVSLLVRLWVEIPSVVSKRRRYSVSLLVRLWVEIRIFVHRFSQILVSLLVRLWVEMMHRTLKSVSMMSASLWGCELKCGSYAIGLCGLPVSLLVRLWVEIQLSSKHLKFAWVSLLVRLWVEIPPRGSPSPPHAVSLLVRLWVEILLSYLPWLQPPVSLLVRLWVEMANIPDSNSDSCQPPCEAVSWNDNILCCSNIKSSQPPCEAVSWNDPEPDIW